MSGSGAAPVGLLHDLPPLNRAVVAYLRHWCAGGAPEVAAEFRARLGPADGARLTRQFDMFLQHCLGEAETPLLRHARGCPCVGVDESRLARQVALAAAGDRDTAGDLAARYLPDAAIARALFLSEELGLALHRLTEGAALAALRPPYPPASERTS